MISMLPCKHYALVSLNLYCAAIGAGWGERGLLRFSLDSRVSYLPLPLHSLDDSLIYTEIRPVKGLLNLNKITNQQTGISTCNSLHACNVLCLEASYS